MKSARPALLRAASAALLASAIAWAPAGTWGQEASLVVVDPVIEQDMAQTTPVLGRLVSRQISEIATRVSGPIDEVMVDVGSRVATGDPLVMLDTGRLALALDLASADIADNEAALAAAQSENTRAQQDLNRLNNLRSSSAFNQASYDDQVMQAAAAGAAVRRAQALLDRAEAALEQATIDLGDAMITAPFPGVVSERYVAEGHYVSVGQPVVRIVNDLELELEANVPTERLLGLSAGAEVGFQLDDGTRHQATLRAIVPEENPLTRTRRVRFTPTFADVLKPLAANQSATVFIPQGPQETVITVAKDAVIASPSGTMVYVVADGVAEMRPIQIGDAVGDRFQVLSGLSTGDLAVTRGNERLQPGQPVAVAGDGVQPDEAAPADTSGQAAPGAADEGGGQPSDGA